MNFITKLFKKEKIEAPTTQNKEHHNLAYEMYTKASNYSYQIDLVKFEEFYKRTLWSINRNAELGKFEDYTMIEHILQNGGSAEYFCSLLKSAGFTTENYKDYKIIIRWSK